MFDTQKSYVYLQGGVLLLFVTLCINSGYNSAAKKLSVDVGGAKRLHAASTLASAVFLWPWACFSFLTTEVKKHNFYQYIKCF